MPQNDPRENEMKKRLAFLNKGLESLRRDTGYPVHIKDFSGLMLSDPVLSELVSYYNTHGCEFCAKIKGVREAREKCVTSSNELLMKRLTYLRNSRPEAPCHDLSDGFFGTCWCGIREYVYPICHGGTVIGALLVGSFRSDARRISHSFSRLCKRYGFDRAELIGLYDRCTIIDEPADVEVRTAILAGYLSMLAEYYISDTLVRSFSSDYKIARRHRLISLATEYITANLSKKISVSDMAVYCMCSESTLNHLFKSTLGRTIPESVAAQRISRAKYLLSDSDLPIERIAESCGFASATYFSVVFRKMLGMTPTEYRINSRRA